MFKKNSFIHNILDVYKTSILNLLYFVKNVGNLSLKQV